MCFLSCQHCPDDTHVSALTRAQLESLMEKMNPDLVPMAASAGDATMLKDFLEKCPAEVRDAVPNFLYLNYLTLTHTHNYVID